MANLRREPVQIPAQSARARDAALGASSTAPRLTDVGAVAVAEKAAGVLAQISGRIGDMADRAAVAEGDAAGGLAGLDPEFRTRGDHTLYGDAYDRAGLETYKSRLTTQVSGEIEGLADKHAHDPGGLTKALSALYQGYANGKGRVLDEARPEFEGTFARLSTGAVRAATRNREARVRADQAAALTADVDSRVRALRTNAYRLGLDSTADAALAAEAAELAQRLQVKGVDGRALYSAEAAQRVLQDASSDVVKHRITGAFARLDVGAKERFLENFSARYLKGGDKLFDALDPAEYESLASAMASDIRSERAAESAGNRELRAEVEAVGRMAEDGITLPEPDLRALAMRVDASGSAELAADLSEAVATQSFVRTASQLPPGDVEAYVAAERQRLGTGATPEEHRRLERAERLASTMRNELASDPLGWADRSGLLVVPQITLNPQDPAASAQSLKARVAAAETVYGNYGGGDAPVYFRPAERQALAAVAAQGGEPMLAISRTITASVAPEQAFRMLAEISKQSPVLAVIGSLQMERGSMMAVTDAVAGIELSKIEGFKSRRPRPEEKRLAVDGTLGEAFADGPKAAAAIVETADAIYEARAQAKSLPAYDEDLYQQALREAAGEVEEGGVVYGGITTLGGGWMGGGRRVVVPSIIRQDGFDDVIGAITDEDLAASRPRTIAGFAGAAEISGATLVSVGNGRYHVFLGDPDGEDPQPLIADGNEPYVLDIIALAPKIRKRVPHLFRGG